MAQKATRLPPVLLIAETRPTVAVGLKAFLADIPSTRSVAIMTGFDHVVAYAECHQIGFIIVGQGLNWAPSLSEFRRLRQKNPSWQLVLLVNDLDRDTIKAGLSEGASGIIPACIEQHEFVAAITRILAGSVYIPKTTTPPAFPPRPLLTPRQLEVLGVLARGNSNKQIAQILAISVSTVSMHLNAAFHILGVHDRTSAALAYNNMGCPNHGYAKLGQEISGRTRY